MKKRIEPVDKEVGARLRFRRKKYGLSQVDIGKAIGITFQQIQKYEKGINRISSSRLQQISAVLKVPVSYFFDGVSGTAEAPIDNTMAEIEKFYASPEGASLLRSFSHLSSKSLRRAIVRLIEAIANSDR